MIVKISYSSILSINNINKNENNLILFECKNLN